MDVNPYLKRINYQGPTAPTAETLHALHLAHLYSVPFENLDIHLGRRITIDEARFFDKIVCQRRGGFCYELNGLFAALLRELGFNVTLLSAGVYEPQHDRFGPDCDHMTLLVQFEERWLVDVGFGDSFLYPLRLDDPGYQVCRGAAYRVARSGDEWTMMEYDKDGKAVDGYRFVLRPRRLYDFTYACHWMQTAPESPFVQKRLCSLARPNGRITLGDLRLIVTDGDGREERLLADEHDYARVLKEKFGMVL